MKKRFNQDKKSSTFKNTLQSQMGHPQQDQLLKCMLPARESRNLYFHTIHSVSSAKVAAAETGLPLAQFFCMHPGFHTELASMLPF
jgi:hypothetical protein